MKLQNMLSIICMLVYMLLLTLKYATSQSKPFIPFYWKTSAATDQVPDYWNHGPIFIPGLQDVFTMTTKKPDIFPPWLTRTVPSELPFIFRNITAGGIMHQTKTTDGSTALTPSIEYIDKTRTSAADTSILTPTESMNTETSTKVPELTKIETYTTSYISIHPKSTMDIATRFTEEVTDKSTPLVSKSMTVIPLSSSKTSEKSPIKQTKKVFQKKITTATISTSTPTPTDENGINTDPFSLFLRKFLRVLSVKSVSELPALVEPFINYMTQLLLDGKLSVLGIETNLYLTKMVRNINLAPDILHKNFYQAYNMLVNRFVDLAKDTNKLLDYMEDMYDEEEEEAMQEVLKLTTLFPKTNRTADDIAQSFVTDIFLNPMHRVSGTWRGKILFNIITDVLKKRISIERRFLENPNEVYKFLKDPQLIDKFVKFKSPHNDRNKHSDIDVYETGNFRRNVFIGNGKIRGESSKISSFEESNDGETSDDGVNKQIIKRYIRRNARGSESSKRTLKPNLLNEDTYETEYGSEIKIKKDNNKQNSYSQSDKSHIGNISKSSSKNYKNSKHKKEEKRPTAYDTLINLKGVFKNTLINDRRFITRLYTKHQSSKGEKYTSKKHTILVPTGHSGTIIIRNIANYDTREPFEGKYNKSKKVHTNNDKQEPVTKLYSKSEIHNNQNALRNKHLLIRNKGKKSFVHQHLKPGPQNKIQNPFPVNMKPHINNFDKKRNSQQLSQHLVIPTSKRYTKGITRIGTSFKMKNTLKKGGMIKTKVNNKNKKTTRDVDNKDKYLDEKQHIYDDYVNINKVTLLSKKKYGNTLSHDEIKLEPQNKLRIKFPANREPKPITKLYNDLKSDDGYKTLHNKPSLTKKKDKENSLLHKDFKPGFQNKKSNKLLANISQEPPTFDDELDSKQLYQDVVPTNNVYSKNKTGNVYNSKNSVENSVVSNSTQYSKNKNRTQENAKDKVKYLDEKEEIYDGPTKESMSPADYSSENSDEIIIRNATRLPGYTQLSKLYSKTNHKYRKYSKHRHHHKNKHKKPKHKNHGHSSHLRYSKRKYEKLKRKYRKLKRLRDLIIAQRQLYANRRTSSTNTDNQPSLNEITVTDSEIFTTPGVTKSIQRSGVPNEYSYNDPESEENYEQIHMETAPENGQDRINLFLEDYDDHVELKPDNQPIFSIENGLPAPRPEIGKGPRFSVLNAKRSEQIDRRDNEHQAHATKTNAIVAQARIPNPSKASRRNMPVFKETEETDEELLLKENLYDAFRHMDFNDKYFNVSRRNLIHGSASSHALQDESYETDVEAVLKRNIYKAVKKLLKK